MSSRIDELPDPDTGDRAHEMGETSLWDSETMRHCYNTVELSPIIAKGNWFDGVEAWF